MEAGFIWPDGSYVQAVGVRDEVHANEILSSYPAGTQRVDLKPSADHHWIDGAWVYIEPEPVVVEPHLNNAALARFGGNPLTVFEKIKVSNVLRISAGRFRVTFSAPYPSSEYAVLLSVYDIEIASARVFNRTATYVEVRTNDALGNPTDLREVTLEAKRVITE